MRLSILTSPAGPLGAPCTPSPLRITANVAPQATAALPVITPPITWGCCWPRHLSPAAPSRHCMSWDKRRLRRNPWLAVLDETSESGPDLRSGKTGSGADAARLQPKPQAKYRRLTVGGPEGAPSKPRRWHKAAYPASSQAAAGPVLSPRFIQSSLAQPGPSGQDSPASYSNAYSSDGSNHEFRPRELHGRGGRRSEQQQQQQQRNPVQRQQQQHGKPQGRAQGTRTAPVWTSSRKTDAYDDKEDDEDDEEEEDDGELLGLSEEELEAMVFASAGATAEPAFVEVGRAGKQRRRGGNESRGDVAAGTGSRPSAADAITAAVLPNEVAAAVLTAVRSGSLSSDGDLLADQLQQLQKAVLAVANGTADGGYGSDCGAVDADALLVASVAAVADLLDCSVEAAAVVLVNYPRYVSMLACGRSGEGKGEGLERLRSFAGMLNLELAEARDIVRRNPALLLAPYEPLRAKLTALANATGLSMAQATAMVTTYMFPEI
ncbi:hypothetical protein Vretifemale_16953 [Volvox reticuliferus]|nr:hypothetical protein Vretifemale_16953 [Volvox reticuliferus]